MRKTININIAGQLFRVDEDAYQILSRYLEHVSARFRTEPGGEETISDIETRIAEIFGGGNEPPTLISKEMVRDMINIMGAPEDYYDEASTVNGGTSYTRKAMYDPNSLSARTGKFLSDFFKGLGKILSAIWRVIAIIIGCLFTVFSFVMLFTFILVLFFHNAPFLKDVIEPEITNLNMLLSIVLNVRMVSLVIILTGIVLILPLAALAYLGIKMIFNIKERSRTLNIIAFVTWIASACALAVILSLQLVVYADHERVEERITMNNPPDTIYIAAGRKVASLEYDDFTSVDEFSLYRQKSADRLFGTVDLNIFGSDTTTGWLSVEKRASSNSDIEAIDNARAISFNWKFRADTLYIDEFFSLPSGRKWNASMVEIDLAVPDNSVIKFVPGSDHSRWMFEMHNPETTTFQMKGWELQALEK